jgi:hypothetical protein
MELEDAVRRIAVIHRGIVRSQLFRGYRAVPTFLSGLLAFLACAAQGLWFDDDVNACVILWACTALASVTIVAVDMILRVRRSNSSLERDMIMGAAEQFIPTIVAGALMTFVMSEFAWDELWLLPALWSMLFSLGIFASRRMLPWAMNIVAGYYLLAGLLCIALGHDGPFFPGYSMAITFGTGQFMAAAILYWSLERRDFPLRQRK